MHAVVDPVLRPLGFTTRKSGPPTWKKKLGSCEMLLMGIQRHPNAVDPYAGGRFRIEIERARTERPYMALAGRAALDQLLLPQEMAAVLAHQRGVITSLQRPPAQWVAIYPESLRETYLGNFDPDAPYRPGNFWHRYRNVEDVTGWMLAIAPFLPSVVERGERLSPGVIYLGGAIDLDSNPLNPTVPIVLKERPSDNEPPPDPAWRPVPRRKGGQHVCAACGKPILDSDITAENVGHPGIYHMDCRLRQLGS